VLRPIECDELYFGRVVERVDYARQLLGRVCSLTYLPIEDPGVIGQEANAASANQM
jgi:hypothetical protein